MKLNKIYIISYFGADVNLRVKRKDAHNKQVEWARSHNLQPVVLAQHYNDDEFIDGVIYIVNNDKLLFPAAARNVLLNEFYKTDDDFAMFADNDMILYEEDKHGTSKSFIEILRSLDIDKFKQIDVFRGIDPARTPFGDEIKNPKYKDTLIFRRFYGAAGGATGGFFAIKNLKKFHNKEIFFDEVNFGGDKIISGEDYDFGITLLMNGLTCYITYNAIYNTLARNSSTWTDDTTDREMFTAWEIINKKYPNMIAMSRSYYIAIGHSVNPIHGLNLRMATDKKERIFTLKSLDHANIVFHDLPKPMIPDEVIEYALKNFTDDTILMDLISKNKNKPKKINRNKAKFNWKCIKNNKDIPLRIEIKLDSTTLEGDEIFQGLFNYEDEQK